MIALSESCRHHQIATRHACGAAACSAWDDPEFVEAVLRLVLSRLVDSQLGIFAMLNFAISIYAVGALTTKVVTISISVSLL